MKFKLNSFCEYNYKIIQMFLKIVRVDINYKTK